MTKMFWVVVVATLVSCSGKVSWTPEPEGSAWNGATFGPLCDGDSNVRLAITISGGPVDPGFEVTHPFGQAFLFVTGTCHYYVSTGFLDGVITHQTLTQQEAAELEALSGWNQVASWGEVGDLGCNDAGTVTVYVPGSATDCSCGCDDQAPEEKSVTLDRLSGAMDAYLFAGSVLDQPVQLFLVALAKVPPLHRTRDFPLTWDPAEVAVSRSDFLQGGEDLGIVIDDPVEASQLREIRQGMAHIDPRIFFRTKNHRYFQAYIIDILPEDVEQSASAFIQR